MVLDLITRETIAFFDLSPWLSMIAHNDFSQLRTPTGLLMAIRPLLPVIVVIELVRALIERKFATGQFKVVALTYLTNRIFGSVLALGAAAWAIATLSPYAPFTLGITWYGFIYAYLVYELGHFIFHFSAHKVRLLWCLHSTHHAPERMDLTVNYSQFYFQGLYSGLVRAGTCALLGVSPELFAVVFACDRIWGYAVHVSERTLPDGRLGWLEHIVLTPSHHRVHHARNGVYLDTNFCNFLNVWDRLFGTYQREIPQVRIEYGVMRKINPSSFLDVYFGEVALLARDVWTAKRWRDKLLYIIMPPGWHPAGASATAGQIRRSAHAALAAAE